MKYNEIMEVMERDLDKDVARYLINWYNVSNLTLSDLELLIELWNEGFVAYSTCKMCSNDGYTAYPDNWDDFQGVYQDDDFETQEITIEGKTVEICIDCYNETIIIRI